MDFLERVDGFTLVAALCLWGVLPWSQRLDPDAPRWLRRLPYLGLLTGPVLACLGPGMLSATLAAPAGLYAVWLCALGLRRFLADDLAVPSRRLLVMLARTGPLVAATAWIWSRLDRTFAGFPDPLATLTTVHFAIAFGALPLAVAAWECSARPDTRRSVGLWLYLLTAPATALCFALREQPLVPGLGEVVCAAGFALGFLLWASGAPAGVPRPALALLAAGFLLGLGYTIASHFGWAYLTIPRMAAVHGCLNLLGTLLLLRAAPRLPPVLATAPDLVVATTPCAPGDALYSDAHRQDIGPWSPECFGRLRAALLEYRFYPETVMVRRAQFEDEGRPARVGDRLGLGLLLPNLPGLPPLTLPAVVEIHVIESSAEHVRLGYRTTRRHYGRGEWVAAVRREGDRLVLSVDCHIRPSRWFVWLGLPLYRRFQLDAFRGGLGNLRQLASLSAPAA